MTYTITQVGPRGTRTTTTSSASEARSVAGLWGTSDAPARITRGDREVSDLQLAQDISQQQIERQTLERRMMLDTQNAGVNERNAERIRAAEAAAARTPLISGPGQNSMFSYPQT